MARKRHDQTIPGGSYMKDARLEEQEDGTTKHFGGRVEDADGKVLKTFKDDEENTGLPDPTTPEIKAEVAARAKAKAAADADEARRLGQPPAKPGAPAPAK